MSLYSAKPRFQVALRGVEVQLVAWGVHADWLTGAAVGVAAAAAGLHMVGWEHEWAALWAVPVLALVRLALNALDGQVARRAGTARPWGAVLNEMGDRLADLFFLAPLALVGPVDARLGLAALTLMLLSSLIGVLGQAVVGTRLTVGVFAKADRMVALALLYGLALTLNASWPLTALFWLIVVGSTLSLAQRLTRLHVLSHRAEE
jgi:CDP-diacylglycerol---glycerol-3-phosphate 3-phosphatidyltransferase